MEFINTPLGYVLKWLSTLFGGNFALAVFVFTLLVNVIMLPLTIKSQKSSASQARLRPKLDALKKKCGDDKMKYNQEMQDLYQKENVSMSGGCLPMIVRLVVMFGVYNVIMSPLQYILSIPAETVTNALNIAKDAGLIANITNGSQIELISLLNNGYIEVAGVTNEMIGAVDFNLLGLSLTETPKFDINIFGGFRPIWLIPILSFFTSILSSIVSMLLQKRANPDAPNMMGMMLMMPVMSLVIAFSVPGAVGFYWAISNVVSGGLQAIIQIFYGPGKIIARDQATAIIKKNKTEREAIAKLENK